MKSRMLSIGVCCLLAVASWAQGAAPAAPGTLLPGDEPTLPGDVLFNLPVTPEAGTFEFMVEPPDVAMFAGTPAPAPPAFAWQGVGGERVFLRTPHHGPELGKWWKDSKIAAELRLTPAQVNQIEQAFFDHRLKLIDLRADLEREETRLQPLMEADQVDEAKVSAQIDLVLAARGRLEKAHTMMMLALRRSLSVEQWKKLESIKREREQGWGGHRFTPATPASRFHLAHPSSPPQPPQPASPPSPKPGERM